MLNLRRFFRGYSKVWFVGSIGISLVIFKRGRSPYGPEIDYVGMYERY
jgi:hypothetical protein